VDEGDGVLEFGARVRRERERRSWSREELAYRAGVSFGGLTQMETGRRRDVRVSSLVGLARALEVPLDRLLGLPAAASLLDHAAVHYRSDDDLGQVIAPFVTDGLAAGDTVLAVVSATAARLLRALVAPDGARLTIEDPQTWYDTPSHALDRYRSFVDEHTAAGAGWVRIIGEPPWPDRTADEIDVHIRYEALLNLVLASAPCTVLCLYDERTSSASVLQSSCRTHPHRFAEGQRQPCPDFVGATEAILDPHPHADP
jgi:transcriptional regulator with XRE-family HTH domain